jgi:hypothetical protein
MTTVNLHESYSAENMQLCPITTISREMVLSPAQAVERHGDVTCNSITGCDVRIPSFVSHVCIDSGAYIIV